MALSDSGSQIHCVLFASGQLCHDPTRIHIAGQHMPMIAIARDDLIALFQTGLHAGNDSLLSDIEMTKSGNLAHAVQLAGAFFKATD